MERGWAEEERAGGRAQSTPVSMVVQDEDPAKKRREEWRGGRRTGLMASGYPMEKRLRGRVWVSVLHCWEVASNQGTVAPAGGPHHELCQW